MAIVGRVCREIGLSEGVVERAVEGAIDPDRNPEHELRKGRRGGKYHAQVSHHKARNRLIMKHLWRARIAKLQNSYGSAGFSLGRALHYVHDRCTGKGFLGLFHDRVEEKVSERSIPSEALQDGFAQSVSHPIAVEKFVGRIRDSNKPEEIVTRASFASAWIAKAIFDLGDVAKARQELRITTKRRRNAAIIAAGTLAAGALFSASALSPLPIIATPIALIMVKHYHRRAGKLRRWFNLR